MFHFKAAQLSNDCILIDYFKDDFYNTSDERNDGYLFE